MAQLNSHIFYGICYVFIPLKILPNFPSDFFFDSCVIKTSSGCLGKGATRRRGGRCLVTSSALPTCQSLPDLPSAYRDNCRKRGR